MIKKLITSIDPQTQRDAKRRYGLDEAIFRPCMDERTVDIVLNAGFRIGVGRQGENLSRLGAIPCTRAPSAIEAVPAQKSTVVNYNRFREAELIAAGSRDPSFQSHFIPFSLLRRGRRTFTLNEYEHRGIRSSGQVRRRRTVNRFHAGLQLDNSIHRLVELVADERRHDS